MDIREIEKTINKRENIARRPGCGEPLTQETNQNLKTCSKCNLIKNILEYYKIKSIEFEHKFVSESDN